jgi:hypothetical protein
LGRLERDIKDPLSSLTEGDTSQMGNHFNRVSFQTNDKKTLQGNTCGLGNYTNTAWASLTNLGEEIEENCIKTIEPGPAFARGYMEEMKGQIRKNGLFCGIIIGKQ